ncbi:MAG: lyase [Myxococcales bacterium]|nr:lyase [Myxococcales bacterium]
MGMVLVGCAGDDGGRGDSSATQASATDASASASASGSAGESEGSTSGGSASGASDSASAGTSAGTSASTSAGTSEGTSEGTSASSGDATSSSGGPVTSGDTTDPTDGSTGGDACMGTEGVFDFSYLWVANTDQGSISKVNTLTLVEEARYYSDPAQSGAADPSRTSVNIDGHYVVVSNRGAGTVTKVAASAMDCVDKNQNGQIDTSPNKDTLLPYAEEECILWTTKVNSPFSVGAGPRATAWAPGTFNEATCKYENQKVWVGYLTAPGQAEIARLNGDTGEIEATIPLPNWPVVIDGANGYAPYGAAADADGYIWTTGVFTNVAYRIHPETLEVKRWDSPLGDSHYGMTVDSQGRAWFANWTAGVGATVFDPKTETWAAVPGSEGILGRGIAADTMGNVWVATNNGGAFGCGMLQVDGNALTTITHHTFDMCGTPLGTSIDIEGKVWMVDYSGWAYQVDPQTYEKKVVPIANVHYTYSDMTGGGLQGAVMPG